jgi:hypothetical protein
LKVSVRSQNFDTFIFFRVALIWFRRIIIIWQNSDITENNLFTYAFYGWLNLWRRCYFILSYYVSCEQHRWQTFHACTSVYIIYIISYSCIFKDTMWRTQKCFLQNVFLVWCFLTIIMHVILFQEGSEGSETGNGYYNGYAGWVSKQC